MRQKPNEIASIHNRLISFLVPIIQCDTSKSNSKIKGNLKINQRLNLTKLVILSTEEIEGNFKDTQDLIELKETMIDIEERLLLQSEIENRLINFVKITKNRVIKENVNKKLSQLNTSIFSPEELISNFTSELGMHKYTLKAIKLIVNQNKIASVNEATRKEITSCYHEIITYSMTKLSNAYPND